VNVLLNGLDGRVEVRREALAAREGSLSLAPSDRQEIPLPMDDDGHFALGVGSNLGAYSFVNDGTGLSAAKAIPLDHLALDDVAFIKVDTQGADGTVLLGAFETITRCRPWVVFEWEQLLAQAFAVSFEEVEARFAAIGYRVRVLHRHNAKQVDYLALPQEEADAVHEGEAG
jgi:FkbM family methyltransferase